MTHNLTLKKIKYRKCTQMQHLPVLRVKLNEFTHRNIHLVFLKGCILFISEYPTTGKWTSVIKTYHKPVI